MKKKHDSEITPNEEEHLADKLSSALVKKTNSLTEQADVRAEEQTALSTDVLIPIEEQPSETPDVLPEQTKKELGPKMKQFIQILKFTGFSISAGIIQFVTTGALSTWTGLIPYWIAYLIGLVLSVVWNFTFNRKFTFRAANNVPLAMSLVVVYYCMFTPISTFGADAIVGAWEAAAAEAWNSDYELVITASMMILNFITEFLWDKFIVFNDKVTSKIERAFKRKHKDENSQDAAEETRTPLLEEAPKQLPEHTKEQEEEPEEIE